MLTQRQIVLLSWHSPIQNPIIHPVTRLKMVLLWFDRIAVGSFVIAVVL